MERMNKIILIIEGDNNDADYVTEVTILDEWGLEQLPIIRKVADVIKNTKRHNWNTDTYPEEEENPRNVYADVLTIDEIDIFEEFTPNWEGGIHTISSIQIIEAVNIETLI